MPEETIKFRTSGTLRDPDHVLWFDSGNLIYESRNCTNCGKAIEGDAHVFSEQILCDTCADAYMEYLEGRG